MRYIRFLKSPRVVTDKVSSKSEVSCLITITSDLGDSFLPYDIQLSAELLDCEQSEEQVLVWRTVQWTASMRSLPVTFPLPKHIASSSLRVRVGVEPGETHDEYGSLSVQDSRGVVSAWSPKFMRNGEALKLVERRFMLPEGPVTNIWEETGESIARHLWDAGITLSCQLMHLTKKDSDLAKALLPSQNSTVLRVLELGTGCGMVGITLAQIVIDAEVLLTDLPEARDIVERNIDEAWKAKGATLKFQELDWDQDLPFKLQSASDYLDLIVAADCTYNPDSSPALVNTLTRLARMSPKVIVAIAMKMRHSSEEVFFHLMSTAGFRETTKLEYPLPGDVEVGEETVYLHVYKYTIQQ
ncbi:hypothetical protein EJ02DRAFT_401910 [Clathrospora elynae]|uniref:Uncharacterized protein n=1 Tax=Clathrospora elynae TaxID=706981 RepID=A0A6A5SSK1_9PLEO|nr:hypothetical protein EJ02DRAFT_401910 [Clathrospora elynae]